MVTSLTNGRSRTYLLNMHRTEGLNYTQIAGKNSFKDTDPRTLIEKDWLNSVQEEIALVIEKADINLKRQKDDTRDQLYPAIIKLFAPGFDADVGSQTSFNSIIERVSANRYQIRDQYKMIYVREFSGGYQCSGVDSYLSGGDTWGYIETNRCTHIFCEPDAYFDFNNERGYLKVTTNGAFIHNVYIKGTGTVASAITTSFMNDAQNVLFFNCKTSDRLSNAPFNGFTGTADTFKALSSRYMNCSVVNHESSNVCTGFSICENLTDCYVYDTLSTTSNTYGFSACRNIKNCTVDKMDTTTGIATAFNLCELLTGCVAKDLDGPNVFCYDNNKMLNGCYAYDIDATTARGFRLCTIVVNCYAEDIDGANLAAGFDSCNVISSSHALNITDTSQASYGFAGCNVISGCSAQDIDCTATPGTARGFTSCDAITGVLSQEIDCDDEALGFRLCDAVSSAYVNDVDTDTGLAYGFGTCLYISSAYANDIDTVSGTAEGFNACQYMCSIHSPEALNDACNFADADDGALAKKFSTDRIWN